MDADKERPHTERVTRKDETLTIRIPERDRPLTVEAAKRLGSPFFVGVNDDFRVAAGTECGNLTINTFGEYGDPNAPGADNIMHAQLQTDNGFTLMASDTPPEMGEVSPAGNITISLSGDDEQELRGYWDKLAEGGTVTMPFEKQMWGDLFGMCTDRFGVPWMVDVVPPQS